MKKENVVGYLPDEAPPIGKLLVFALQQVLVMFPATVAVALITGFHISTTIFASGLATIGFLLITRGKIPLYYGSSFSYISAISSIVAGRMASDGIHAADIAISEAQFGIIMSGLVSIVAGLLINKVGMKAIEKVLPPTITGPIAMIIGLSLAGNAMQQAFGFGMVENPMTNDAYNSLGLLLPSVGAKEVGVAIFTLLVTVGLSVFIKKGVASQLTILFGLIIGYIVSIPLGLVDVSGVFADSFIKIPHFTLPRPTAAAVFAIMPIALATIPESAAHLFQLDIYVDDLAARKGKKGAYKIADKLGLNLIGDGAADIISALFGGPAGTNYGENVSVMAITRNFSVKMLGGSAIIAMILAFVSPLSNLIATMPQAVVGGACIYLFGVIGAQGIAIMIEEKVDMFSSKNLAVIAIIFIVGLGGHYGFDGSGMIPIYTNYSGATPQVIALPAIATAAIFGIILNLVLSIGDKDGKSKAEAK